MHSTQEPWMGSCVGNALWVWHGVLYGGCPLALLLSLGLSCGHTLQ